MVAQIEHLASILNAILHGGPVPQAALEAWPHERLVREGWVTLDARYHRYRVAPKGLLLSGVSFPQPPQA